MNSLEILSRNVNGRTIMTAQTPASFDSLHQSRSGGTVRRHHPPLFPRRRAAASRLGGDSPDARREGCREAVGTPARAPLRALARRHDGQPGHADGPRRSRGDLSVGMAGRGGFERRRRHVSRPIALSGQFRPRTLPPDQPDASSAPTRSSMRKAAPSGIGSCPSWPMPKPASAARSTPSRS